ncbi:hypothetical protein Cgig2_024384 [Carnegiea gigantea]|uniref:Transmembrane protein n=1 Tax=Carnegiea gigantea TaxID=171969 RepID=A0A9Q1JW86_9CARY|nr:hypothetical protein Cgig2_024384 [Carnegiea gigantea]
MGTNLLCLSLNAAAPFLLMTLFILGLYLLLGSLAALKGDSIARACSKVRSKLGEEWHKVRTQSILGVILKYKEAGDSKKEVILEGLPIARLGPPVLGLFSRVHYFRHEGRKWHWTVVFSYIILKITRSLCFFHGRLPKRIMDCFSIIPIRKVTPTRRTVNEEEVVLSVL